MPLPVLASARKLSKPQPKRKVQNRRKIRAPTGSSRLLTIKSSIPRIFMPKRLNPERRLNPNIHGRLSTNIKTPLKTVARFRDHPKLSMQLEIRFSNTAVMVEKLAKLINKKNKAPQILPNGILMKILGSATKISDGPSCGATSKLKHAGNIIRPLIKATKVSSAVMRMDSLIKVLSFDI